VYFFPSSTKRRRLAGIISASYVTGSDFIHQPEDRKFWVTFLWFSWEQEIDRSKIRHEGFLAYPFQFIIY
jgi:hypothetical protein